MDGNGVWAITTFFNPGGYASRQGTFQEFRRRLAVPLLAIEYSTDGRFVLDDTDADIVVRVSGNTVLWQKERLLNIALTHLPEAARHIAWVDSDIIFADPQWPARLQECLVRSPLAQCYSHSIDLPQGELPEQADLSTSPKVPSAAWLLANGKWPAPEFKPATGMQKRVIGCGFAWGARRDVLERHGFYDAMIIGAGDRALISAAIGHFEETIVPMHLSPERAAHYMAWASPFHEEVKGQVGVVEGLVYHLWHGKISNRRYVERYLDLAQTGFTPARHIRIGDSGAWEWTEDASPELQSVLTRYFEMRQEDTA